MTFSLSSLRCSGQITGSQMVVLLQAILQVYERPAQLLLERFTPVRLLRSPFGEQGRIS